MYPILIMYFALRNSWPYMRYISYINYNTYMKLILQRKIYDKLYKYNLYRICIPYLSCTSLCGIHGPI